MATPLSTSSESVDRIEDVDSSPEVLEGEKEGVSKAQKLLGFFKEYPKKSKDNEGKVTYFT